MGVLMTTFPATLPIYRSSFGWLGPLICLSLALPSGAIASDILLPEGTRVRVRFPAPLSSEKVRPGQSIELEVAQEVRIKGAVVIAKGAPVSATVEAQSTPAKRGFKGGELRLNIESAQAVSGAKVALFWTGGAKGFDMPEGAGQAAWLALLFSPVMKGQKAEISRGSTTLAVVRRDTALDGEAVAKFNQDLEAAELARRSELGNHAILFLYRMGPQLVRSEQSFTQEYISPASSGHSLGRFAISLDGKEAIRLKTGESIVIRIEAGAHSLESKKQILRIMVNPGDQAFVRIADEDKLMQRVTASYAELDTYLFEPAPATSGGPPPCSPGALPPCRMQQPIDVPVGKRS